MTLPECLRACMLIVALILCASCRQQETASASDIALELSPAELRVGETAMTLRVRDKDGKPVSQPGKLSLRGDMNHAGMTPVLAESGESENGVFHLPFDFTMGGSWQIEASLELPNGEIVRRTFDFDIMNDGMRGDGAGMENMAGVNSAAYMQIQNHSVDDIALVAAESDAADSVSFHHTQIVNDMAQMMSMDTLVVPANGEIKLAPGGMHLMLHGLKRDLSPDDRFGLVLTDGAGRTYRMAVRVSEQPPADADDATRIHDLTFQRIWARPVSAG